MRGRRIPVLDAPGLRPTGDRIRETLFNWLAPLIHGARVLDLYAGSGALGLEAASRGAGCVDLVEAHDGAARRLSALISEFRLAHVEVHACSAESFLGVADQAWDIILLDPPFAEGPSRAVLEALARAELFPPGCQVYAEMDAATGWPLPARFIRCKEKTAGAVRYALFSAE